MTVKNHKQHTQRSGHERVRVYLYGADREATSGCVASFAGGGSGGVACGQV